MAEFQATVDLAQSGQQWTYTGRFLVTSSGGQWTIHWTPSLINPSLAAGDRLAAVTTFPQRAQITDMNGQPLVTESADYQVGVYPDRLTNEAATAAKFSAATGLDQQQVLGQIQAAPPDSFLSLLTLQAGSQAGSFTAEWPKLAKVPGLGYVRQTQRLFDSLEPQTVGQVGTEDSPVLRAEGAAYQPGMTVGAIRPRADLPGRPGRHADHLDRRGELGRAHGRDAVGRTGPPGHDAADDAEQPPTSRPPPPPWRRSPAPARSSRSTPAAATSGCSRPTRPGRCRSRTTAAR